MSHGGKPGKTCKFGHVFKAWEEGSNDDLQKKIENGEVQHLDDFGEGESLMSMLNRWKYLKFRSSDQGTAYTGMWVAVDELDSSLDYEINKISESIHISPQSQMHAQFMERKQQAENNIKQTMQSYQQLEKQKHMLQHDIRKLRSRVEAINSHDEVLLKGDFIELVDGAGQSPRQGGDQMSLKAYRDQNIYPSIVADFNEMEGVEDLETAEQRAKRYDDKDEDDLEDGPLADIPTNEKAVLKKKWKMYEKWKDLYGSEVERKLNDLKGQMKNIQRSIEETEEWLEPYVRDAAMINRMGDDQAQLTSNLNIRGNSTMFRTIDWIVHKGMRLHEGEMMIADELDEEPTHYRVMMIKTIHANIAGFSQPQTPAEGPSAGIVMWYPFFTCKHVFDNFVQPKIDKHEKLVEDMMDDYTGKFETKEGDKLKEARNDEEMSVRELREKVGEKLDDDEKAPIQLSSDIRRVEDGLETATEAINDKYLKKIDEILDIELHPDNQDSDNDDDMYEGFSKTLREFTGQTDEFKIPSGCKPLDDFTTELRYNYYWGLKLDFGMYTMK
ncbi:helix-turn-helix domain-containing protein [Candidatus Nanohalobium constans]|uniref:Uncharacterized protein n=1 Tax=Candidatus Nanohalobium constans TaxID=2565781 RepID=A0A5Q0UGB6_9ARCH|nr:hypothetical protein [Candidatus Nanohalobium constans]QGA80692.1 hypothetical protein LC1Nh_0808 [Candidatus Nanohalobium constans]